MHHKQLLSFFFFWFASHELLCPANPTGDAKLIMWSIYRIVVERNRWTNSSCSVDSENCSSNIYLFIFAVLLQNGNTNRKGRKRKKMADLYFFLIYINIIFFIMCFIGIHYICNHRFNIYMMLFR